VFLFSISSFAQEFPQYEASFDYSLINARPSLDFFPSFNLNGGGGAFVYNFTPLLGIKSEFEGYAASSGFKNDVRHTGFSGSASGNLFTYMFGLQVKKHDSVLQPFGEALFGGAHSNAYATILKSLGLVPFNYNGSNNGFAMEFGGGLDWAVGKKVQVRPVEVDYLYTHFGANHIKGYSAGQNNFKYVVGVNFVFGK
jgi:hypothetical protein